MPARPAVLGRTAQSHRARTLASDDRAGSWARAQVLKRWADFVRTRWRLLAGMALDAGTTEKSMVLASLYERDGLWRFRAIGQGYDEGLLHLAVLYGVDVED